MLDGDLDSEIRDVVLSREEKKGLFWRCGICRLYLGGSKWSKRLSFSGGWCVFAYLEGNVM
jgi:hypothetical protein